MLYIHCAFRDKYKTRKYGMGRMFVNAKPVGESSNE